MGRIFNWLKSNHNAGDPSRTTPTAEWCNRVANILENMTMTGGHIEKPKDSEGKNWKFIVDGSSDETPPSGYVAPWDAPSDYYWNQYTVGSPTVETTEFRTTNNVTVGGLRADDTVATVGTSAVPFGGGYFGFGTTFNGARFHAGLSAASAFNAYWSSGGTVTQAKGPSTSFAMQTIKGSQQVTLCDGTDAVATAGDVNMSTGSVLKVAGTQVVKARLGALGAAVGTATNGGYGFASQSEFDAFIAKVNSIIGALGITGGHGLTGD